MEDFVIVYDETTTNETKTIYDETAWGRMDRTEKTKLIAKDVASRRKIYLSPVLHFSDTISDYAAVAEFYLVAKEESDCNGLNMWGVFFLSASTLVLYRVIAAFKIWQISQIVDGVKKPWARVLRQLLDLELFHILYLNHTIGLNGSSSPQRLLKVLEAVFEAAPQTVIQLTYLMYSNSASPVVIGSTMLSMLSLTKTVADDDLGFWDDASTGNKHWIFVVLFRIVDIPSKLFLYSLLWYGDLGWLTCVDVGLNFFVAFFVYGKLWKNDTDNGPPPTDALLIPVATPLFFGESRINVLVSVLKYSSLECIVATASVWFFTDIVEECDCWCLCLWIFVLAVVASLLVAVKCAMMVWWINFARNNKLPSKEKSDLKSLLHQGSFEEAMELIVCCAGSVAEAVSRKYSNGKEELSLLYIAQRVQNRRLVQTVWRASSDDDREEIFNNASNIPNNWNGIKWRSEFQCLMDRNNKSKAFRLILETEQSLKAKVSRQYIDGDGKRWDLLGIAKHSKNAKLETVQSVWKASPERVRRAHMKTMGAMPTKWNKEQKVWE